MRSHSVLQLPCSDTRSRHFQTFGAFTSGIGIHYAPSAIVNAAHQSAAAKLIVGQRMPPHVFVRCADGRPYEIQDLLPADTRYKIIVFAGDTPDTRQATRVTKLAEYLDSSANFYRRFGGSDPSKVFEILTISSAPKEKVNYTDVPKALRPHWSKYVHIPMHLCKVLIP